MYKKPGSYFVLPPKRCCLFFSICKRVSYSQSLRAAFQYILRRRPMFRRNLQLEMHRCETETWQRKVQGSHGVAIASCLLASDEYLRNVNFKDTTYHDKMITVWSQNCSSGWGKVEDGSGIAWAQGLSSLLASLYIVRCVTVPAKVLNVSYFPSIVTYADCTWMLSAPACVYS